MGHVRTNPKFTSTQIDMTDHSSIPDEGGRMQSSSNQVLTTEVEDFGTGIINYLRKPGFIHYDNSDD